MFSPRCPPLLNEGAVFLITISLFGRYQTFDMMTKEIEKSYILEREESLTHEFWLTYLKKIYVLGSKIRA